MTPPRLIQLALTEKEFLALFNSAALGVDIVQTGILLYTDRESPGVFNAARDSLLALGRDRWNAMLERSRLLTKAAWDLDSGWVE